MAGALRPFAATVAVAVVSLLSLAGAHEVVAPGIAVRPDAAAPNPEVLRGRALVINHDCSGCHGGTDDPSSPGWLAGEPTPDDQFLIGACNAANPNAQPCFHTHPRNLTPDNETGLGRFTERQLFNALRYGLRPEDTPDVTVTSTTPGKGNFPLHPHYLAPPMPWPAWRHMPESDLRAIAAYLHRGLKPVSHKIVESEGPPDFWASAYAGAVPRVKLGPMPSPAFPTDNEQATTTAMVRAGKK